MRVPVRRQSETRISQEQQGFARPVQPLNLEPVTRLVEGFRDQILDEQDARQRIELNRRLMTEVNELQLDFAGRQRNPEIPPEGFAEGTNAAYTERHNAILTELRGGNYSEELVDDFEARLGTVRQGFFERGLGHQLTQLRTRAVEEIEDISDQGSRYAGTDYRNYSSARDTVRESIVAHPDLTLEEREALIDQQLAVVRDAASRRYAIQNPQEIIDLLDPQGLTAPYPTTTAPGATTEGAPVTQGTSVIETAEAENPPGILYREFRARGWTDAGARQMVAQIGRENRFDPRYLYGEHQDANPRAGTNIGMVSWNGPRRTAFLQFMTERGLVRDGRIVPGPESLRAQVEFVDQEMRERYPQSAAAVRDPNGTYDTIEQTLSNNYFVWDRAGRVVGRNTAQRGLSQMRADFDRYGQGGTQTTAGEAPAFRPAPASSSGGGGRGPAPSFIPTPEEQAAAAGTEPTTDVRPPVTDIANVRTGNALLDDLNGSERLQLLGRAREQQTRVLAGQRAEMDVRIGNITAEALNNGGEIATPLPAEQEVLQTYGPVEGPQRWAQITQSQATGRAIVTFRTQSAAQIQQTLDNLEPRPGSPTYQTQLQIYQAAERAAQSLLTERQQDPAAYAMRHFPQVAAAARQGTAQYYAALDRVYETLGIDARTAPVMTADQTRELTQQYRSMNAPQRSRFMQENMEEMGEARFRRFVRNMEGTTAEVDARIYALVRNYPGRAVTGTLYNQILEGREIIALDPARRPRSEAVLEVFRQVGLNSVRDLDAETSRSIQEAAEGIYVQRGGDPVNINRTLYREALTAVLGGNLPADMRRGAVPDYTILPARVNVQQFRTWMERQTHQTLITYGTERQAPRWGDLRTPVPMQKIIDEGVFVMVAPNYYMIRMASDGRPLKTPNGNNYIMRIDAQGLMNIRPGTPAAPPTRFRGEGGAR